MGSDDGHGSEVSVNQPDYAGELTFDRLAREELEVRAELLKQGRGLNPAHNLSRDEIQDRALR